MINIIFSTFNGEKTLPIMLDAFCDLENPSSDWKIIAVDNGSTDNTANIINKYKDKLPIAYLFEKKRGKNNALNYAINYIDGGIVVFTDDDVIPKKDWLVQIEKCVKMKPEYTIFGGKIEPYWPKEPEDWILKNIPLGVTYALTDENQVDGEIFPGLVWGPNMAIRSTVFNEGFRFDSNVGPNEGNYRMGSETEFVIRLDKAGYKSWYCSKAIVQHIIRDYQLEPEWIVGRAYRFGRNMYRQELDNSDIPRLLGIPRWMFAKQLTNYKNLFISFFLKDKVKFVVCKWEIKFFNGYLYESLINFKNKDIF